MAKERFITQRFSPANHQMIDRVNQILDEYARQGYTLSLRQLYYQLVSRDIIANNLQSYKRLGDLVSNARLAGLVDWAMIEDRGREYVLPSHWDDPESIVQAAAYSYRIDKWADQPTHVEVMVEKDALSGVLEPVTRSLDIGFTANRGYSSSSAMYEAGQRMNRAMRRGKQVVVFYLGDHDPSGIDMTRDVLDRLELFSRNRLQVERLALNMDQVEHYRPPENPAKLSDSRAQGYILQFGTSSWELDALEPSVLAGLVNGSVLALRDDALWLAAVLREKEERETLEKIAGRYGDVVAYLEMNDDNDD